MRSLFPMNDRRGVLKCATVIVFILAAAGAMQKTADAGLLDGIAAMGDSLTDGGAPNGSWVPPLVSERGLNFGGAGNPFNVAIGGATSSTLLGQGQHTDVAAFVQNGGVTLATLMIGGNDFLGSGFSIATGSLSGAALDAFLDGVAANIITAANTVLAEGPRGFILAGVPDVTLAPAVLGLPFSPAQRQNLVDAVDVVNNQLIVFADNQSIPFLDSAAWMRDTLVPGSLVVGGVTINVTTASASPSNFFIDSIHPGIVGNGLLANAFVAAMDVAYNAGVVPLSDLEILTLAGLQGSYTGETFSNSVDLSQYVLFTPAAIFGDISGDGQVDIGDFTLWGDAFGNSGIGLPEDLSGDGQVDIGDFTLWADNFGNTAGVGNAGNGANAVPEPSSAVLLLMGVVAFVAYGWRRQRKV